MKRKRKEPKKGKAARGKPVGGADVDNGVVLDAGGKSKGKVWKKVEVDQDVLLENTEGDWGGFLELEVLEEVDLDPKPSQPADGGQKESDEAELSEPKAKKKKKNKKKKKGKKEDGENLQTSAETSMPATKTVSRANMKKWKPYNLDNRIVESLKALGFTQPTPIQTESLATSLSGEADVVGAAQTGSGKTLAFALPMVQRILRDMDRAEKERSGEDAARKDKKNVLGIRALILSPTRELALQIKQHIDNVAQRHGIYTAGIVGGMSQQKQERVLKNLPHIVVGTPGRLWELIQGDTGLSNLSTLSFFVLDEADRMVEQGHFQELSYIIDRVPFSKRLQTFVFSATLTMPKVVLKKKTTKKAKTSVGAIMKKIKFRENVQTFDLTRARKMAAKIEESVIHCSEESRIEFLYLVLATIQGRTLVFCNAISTIRSLHSILDNLGLPVSAIHAQQQQRQRLKALDGFKNGKKTILLATDVAARGLDIPEVRCVIQYQLPDTSETYVHRAGRTARAEADGRNILFVVPKNAKHFHRLRYSLKIGDDLPHYPIDHSAMPQVRTRLKLAKKIDDISRSERKQKAKSDWMHRNAEAAGIILDEDEGANDEDEVANSHRQGKMRQQKLKSLQQQLQGELSKPLKTLKSL